MRSPLFKKADWIYYRSYLLTLLPLLLSLLFGLLLAITVDTGSVNLGILGALIAGGMLATAWLAMKTLRRFLHPLTLLCGAMQRFEAGANNVKVHQVSQGEMGELERGFNAMVSRIKANRDAMQEEVELATSELNQTLEALQIRNAELDLARKRAIDANRLKSDFLANMSHEIRTPMNGIIGFSDLLANTDLQAHQAEYVSTIRRSAQSLLRIIDNILEYSTLESGELSLQQRPFSLRNAVESAVQLHAPQAHAKRLELVSLVYSDVPDGVVGDQARMVQLLSNLLSNAIKFTAAGEVVLRVMLENEQDDPLCIGLTVSDTGIGIPMREQELMFQAFQQGSLSAKRMFGGAGLGLSICQTLALAMGGSVKVSSNPDEGSTFQASIRLALDPEAQSPPLPSSTGRLVLLLEQHSLARIMIREALLGLGLGVEAFEHLPDLGELPLDKADLAVVGCGSDRQQQATALRLVDQWCARNKPCLVLVGSSDPEVMRPFRETGATCLGKPPPRQALLMAIRCLLRQPEPPPATSPSVERPARSRAGGPLAGMRCVAADDNPINLQLLIHYIEMLGGKAVPANDGRQALDACRSGDVDIAVLDIHMPNMNGLDAARGIRDLDRAKDIPLIALTADVAEQNRRDVLRSGFDLILSKPLTEQQFRVALNRFFQPGANPGDNDSVMSSVELPDSGSESRPQLQMRDRDHALRIAGGSKEVAEKLYSALLSELPNSLLEIHRLFDSKALNEMWHEVHRLHGATAVCAVPSLHQALNQLQSVIRLEDHEQIGLWLAKVQLEANRLVDEDAS